MPITIRPLPWDSEQLGVSSGLIECTGLTDCSDRAISAGLQQAAANGLKFLTAKIDARHTGLVNALIKAGGNLVDTELTFQKQPSATKSALKSSPELTIEKLETYWDDSFYALAQTLEQSRFYMDTQIHPDRAHKLWESSIYNSCHGRASYSIVGFVSGRPAGLVNVFEKGGISDIFLIAVLPAYQGKGVGRAMLNHYENTLGPEIRSQTVETQLINFPAQSLYSRMGYRNVFSKHIIHLWL